MAYLDELKQKAAQVEAEQAQAQAHQDELAARFANLVEPRLRELYQYAHEVCQQLNVIKPDIRVSYTLEHFGAISDFVQSDYLCSSYNDKLHSFFVRISSLHHGKKPHFFCTSQMLIKIVNDYLWDHNIRFDYRQKNDANHQFVNGLFELHGDIISEFKFVADYENSAIALQIRNFDKIGRRHYLLMPEHIDHDFMDNLGRYITRAVTKADFLTPYQVDNESWWLKKGEELLAQRRHEEALARVKASLEENPADAEHRRQGLEALRAQALADELHKARNKSASLGEMLKTSFKRLFGEKK
jgi:hypothetical protein